MTPPLLSISDLSVDLATPDRSVRLIDGVSLAVEDGTTLALVGESGCGKSLLCRSVLGLLPPAARIAAHSAVTFDSHNLAQLPERALVDIRGRHLAMVFQEPKAALNPVMTVGRQIAEPLVRHLGLARADAATRAIALMDEVGIAEPAWRARLFPHQLSGGMRQRVCLAMALACGPRLLIADEPTTALDVTVQAEILQLLQRERQARRMAMILVTHDMAIAASTADAIAVMYAGRIVEIGRADAVLARPLSPYTRSLMAAVPHLDQPCAESLPAIPGRPPNLLAPPPGCRFAPRCPDARDRCRQVAPPLAAADAGSHHRAACWFPRTIPVLGTAGAGGRRRSVPAVTDDPDPVLEVHGLTVTHGGGRNGARLEAVSGVSLAVGKGETLGLAGESGCGKTSVARAIIQVPPPQAGAVLFRGEDICRADRRRLRALRRRIQIVFQDPASALNPQRPVGDTIAEPPRLAGVGPRRVRVEQAAALMEAVGLDHREVYARRPFQLSGGQCQRVNLARALAARPDLLICDEPVSSLDVSTQAQIVNLLADVRRRFGLSILFISHDLALVRHLSDRVAVMYLGRLCEEAPTPALFRAPRHPYTRALLAAVPRLRPPRDAPRQSPLIGERPSPLEPPSGCRFRSRCPQAQPRCASEVPAWRELAPAHRVACHFPLVAP